MINGFGDCHLILASAVLLCHVITSMMVVWHDGTADMLEVF